MSFHDRVAQAAFRDGNTPDEFRTSAQKHANAFWFFLLLGLAIALFASLFWAVMPLALAGIAALRSISATLTARRLQSLREPPQAVKPTVTLPPQSIDLNSAVEVSLLDDIREKYSNLLADETEPYAACLYRPASTLPYPKEAVHRALTALLDYVEGRRESALLAAEIRSPDVADMLRTGLRLLDDFLDVPAESLPVDPAANARLGMEIRARQARA